MTPRALRAWRKGLLIGGPLAALFALGLFAPREFRSGKRWAPEDAAEYYMKMIADAVDMYVFEHRELPPTLDGLVQPSRKTGESYIDEIPLDPWNHAYEYVVLDAPTRRFRLRSYGPDGRVAIGDDLTWPKEER